MSEGLKFTLKLSEGAWHDFKCAYPSEGTFGTNYVFSSNINPVHPVFKSCIQDAWDDLCEGSAVMQSSGYQAVDVWKQNMKQPVSVRIMHVKVLTVSYRGKYMDPEPATYTRIPLVIGVIHGDAESPMLVHVGIGIHPMCHENRDFCLEVCKRLWSLLDMDTQIGTDQWPPILHWEAHIPSNSARCEFLEDVYKMQNFARSATKFLAWSTHSGREGSIEAEVYYRPPQSLLASAAPTPRAPGAVHILEPNDFLEDDDADYYGDGCEDSSESDN